MERGREPRPPPNYDDLTVTVTVQDGQATTERDCTGLLVYCTVLLQCTGLAAYSVLYRTVTVERGRLVFHVTVTVRQTDLAKLRYKAR